MTYATWQEWWLDDPPEFPEEMYGKEKEYVPAPLRRLSAHSAVHARLVSLQSAPFPALTACAGALHMRRNDDLLELLWAWLLFHRLRPLRVHSGRVPTAAEASGKGQKNLGTNVFATVNCSAWRQGWARAMMTAIIDAYQRCSTLIFICVKGGPASNQEMAMLHDVLVKMGFVINTDRKEMR